MRALLLIGQAAVGVLTLALGSVSLSSLAAVYRSSDLAVTETPKTFQAWLASLGGGPEDSSLDLQQTPELVGTRLLSMSLEKRRAVALPPVLISSCGLISRMEAY